MMFGGALVLAAGLAQSTPAPGTISVVPNESVVRVHFSTPRNAIEARLWAKRAGDSNYTLVCAAPCRADVPAGTPLRVAITDHEDEPYDFTLTNDMGREVDIVARRGGRGGLAGGIVMTSVGGLTLLVGVILTAVSFANVHDQSAFRTAGLVCVGIGGGLVVGGVTLIGNRSYEPVVRQSSWEGHRSENDGAPSRWSTITRETPLPTAATPLSFTVAF